MIVKLLLWCSLSVFIGLSAISQGGVTRFIPGILVSTTILFYLIVIRANSVTYSSLKQFNTKTGVLSIASSAGTLCCVADTIYHMVMKSGAISKLMSKGISTTTIQAVVVIVLLTMSFIAMYGVSVIFNYVLSNVVALIDTIIDNKYEINNIVAIAVCVLYFLLIAWVYKDAVEKVITEVNPDAVIHCAAWTAVDMAEDEDKVSKVRAINAGGTQNIADVCKKLNCKMTYISTDYVFDGQGTEPWQPDCKDYKPLNVYGQTKLEGELAVSQTLEKYFIVRIAWVFGLNGKNFIKTMLNVGKTHDTVRVVNDQIGTPTYTYDLARLLVDMNETEKYGYYHATNEGGYISWYDFTKEIYRQAGYKTEVLPVTTAEYGLSKAARPFNSRLDKSKLVEAGFAPLPTWQDALSRYLKEIEQ